MPIQVFPRFSVHFWDRLCAGWILTGYLCNEIVELMECGCCASLSRRANDILRVLGGKTKPTYADRIPETLTPEHFNLHEVSKNKLSRKPQSTAYICMVTMHVDWWIWRPITVFFFLVLGSIDIKKGGLFYLSLSWIFGKSYHEGLGLLPADVGITAVGGTVQPGCEYPLHRLSMKLS